MGASAWLQVYGCKCVSASVWVQVYGVQVYGCKCMGASVWGASVWGASVWVQAYGVQVYGCKCMGCKCMGASAWLQVYGCKCMGASVWGASVWNLMWLLLSNAALELRLHGASCLHGAAPVLRSGSSTPVGYIRCSYVYGVDTCGCADS